MSQHPMLCLKIVVLFCRNNSLLCFWLQILHIIWHSIKIPKRSFIFCLYFLHSLCMLVCMRVSEGTFDICPKKFALLCVKRYESCWCWRKALYKYDDYHYSLWCYTIICKIKQLNTSWSVCYKLTVNLQGNFRLSSGRRGQTPGGGRVKVYCHAISDQQESRLKGMYLLYLH